MASLPTRTVLVTGANGYLASHIVQQLLVKGHDVRACVRNSGNSASVEHFLEIPSSSSTGTLSLFSTGDIGDTSLRGRYIHPLRGCDAVIHTATPLRPKFAAEGSGRDFDGVRDLLTPGMEGTRELLDAILACPSVRCLVLTSSMSAAAPPEEPAVKDESHWSDDAAQLARGNHYGCLKTRQERHCHEWVQTERGTLPAGFRFAAVCPTMIIGPPLGAGRGERPYAPAGTMGVLHRWMTGGRRSAPNDSMSFVHVRDCAAMHVAAMENANAAGRYFSLAESWHWNEILAALTAVCPAMPLDTPYWYEGDDVATPTQFNLERMNSLEVEAMNVTDILAESVAFFKDVGVLT